MKLFEAGTRAITIGDREFEMTSVLLEELRSGLRQLIMLTIGLKEASGREWEKLVETLFAVRDLAARQRITQESIDELSTAIADLEPREKAAVMDFLNGLASSAWASALLEAVRHLGA